MPGLLDMFGEENAAGSKPTINEGDRLPATFGDSFDAAHNDTQLFSNSGAAFAARTQAINEYVGMVQRAGGDYESYLPKPAELQKRYPVGVYTEDDKLNAANSALKALGPNPYLPPPMTMDDVGRRADELMTGARLSLQDQQSRPQTWGSFFGKLAGGAVGGMEDPINLPLMLAPEGGPGAMGVVRSALGAGAMMGGTQTINEIANMRTRERALPGYVESGAMSQNVIDAVVQGAVIGGVSNGFGQALARIITGKWPRALQDAANVAKSEDNIARTNVLPGAEGEAEHRAALSTAMNQILRGDPVDVTIGEASRAVVTRAEAERQGFVLPRSANMGEISRLAEEAGLNTRLGEIGRQLSTMPESEAATTAADRLNRLDAVESQLGRAETAAEKKALLERRDQILVDTNPEELQKAAQPLQDRQRLITEQWNINGRINEIREERAREQLAAAQGPPGVAPRAQELAPAAPGEMQVPRTLFDVHEMKIGYAARTARDESLGPFRLGETKRIIHSLAADSGYAMPSEDALALAERVTKANSDEEARAILQQAAQSPRTVLSTTPSASAIQRADQTLSRATTVDARTPVQGAIERARPENISKILVDPKETEAHMRELMRHLDDEAKAGREAQIHTEDAEGNATTRSLASVLDDARTALKAAEALDACNAEMAS
jgi:hypothetical protein